MPQHIDVDSGSGSDEDGNSQGKNKKLGRGGENAHGKTTNGAAEDEGPACVDITHICERLR